MGRRTTLSAVRTSAPEQAFRHEALLYAGDAEYVDRVGTFVRAGVERGEAVLVVVPARKVAALREHLDGAADAVEFADMDDVGANPARIIPAWRHFLDARAEGRGVRGVGEPVHPGRSAAALVECVRHEALLNLAFAGSGAWSLLCPYDVSALAPDVVAEALRTHPYVDSGASSTYDAALPADPLPPPPADRAELAYGSGRLAGVHDFVRDHAAAAGMSAARATDLDIAVHELAVNTITHAGGDGLLLFWCDGDDVVCEVRDGGVLTDPLAGRVTPTAEQESGRGLWIVNQLCELVQVRSSRAGTAIRIRLARS